MNSDSGIPKSEVQHLIALDNPWWQGHQHFDSREAQWPRRAYFDEFFNLSNGLASTSVLVLTGPRQVGKTVMIRQAIAQLLQTEDIDPNQILHLQLSSPIYYGRSLQNLVQQFHDLQHPGEKMQWVFFDDIQYVRDWQSQLGSLILNYPNIRFVASLPEIVSIQQSDDNTNTGQFIPFILPPLTFFEYLQFTGHESDLIVSSLIKNESRSIYQTSDIKRLNEEFINYINFGGFPESALNSTLSSDESQMFSGEAISKVIFNDQASLYGITDTQELNRFLCQLAHNTGQEFGVEELSKKTKLSKARIISYLNYLETSNVIRCVNRINESATRMLRERTFKIHLINPSLRTLLLGKVSAHDEAMTGLVKTAVWTQWMHSRNSEYLYYSRWKEGRQNMEIDLVGLDEQSLHPLFAVNIRWSDQVMELKKEAQSLLRFSTRYTLGRIPLITTQAASYITSIDGIEIELMPTALYCYTISYNLARPR